MVKKSALALCSVALLAAAVALPASAQDVQHSTPLVAHATYTNLNGGEKITPAFTIFSNFGTPATTNSWAGTGYYILGSANSLGDSEQWIAVAFSPKVNSHATKIEVPVQCNSGNPCIAGQGKFEQSLQADCTGLPCGTPIAGTSYMQQNANTPFFTCCTAADAKTQSFIAPGVALTAGTQYWVVVDTNGAGQTTTLDVWADSGTQLQGFSEAAGPWGSFPGNGASAALVSGTNP